MADPFVVTVTLSDVTITEYRRTGQTPAGPVDEVRFDYRKIMVSYLGQDPDGALATPVTATWETPWRPGPVRSAAPLASPAGQRFGRPQRLR